MVATMKQIEEAQEMVAMWKKSYMDTRQKIEHSGKGQRWEFDRKRLFRKTDYIETVCQELHELTKVLYHFENIFGAELRAIVNDPSQVDTACQKVKDLMSPIIHVEFNLFSEKNEENWQALITNFYKQVELLENDAKYFIDDSFKVLRSSEEALEMLLKFKHIETRQTIQDQLMTKFDLVMLQFNKEIALIELKYLARKEVKLLIEHIICRGCISWDENGEFSIYDTLLSTNILYVFNDLVRARRHSEPSLGQEFLTAFQKINVPKECICKSETFGVN
uniref:(California timema) hypothetical protein n=1 Tax=Timema californicum TaxID=61474 RepID=A0A7R9JH94_TIMCA|nr:unnamed protein product [Timema californicum]